MSYKCKVCEKEFESERGLHGHFKTHGMTMAEYYVEFYPRKNMLTGELLPFKKKEEYFEKDFLNGEQLERWCRSATDKELKEYIMRKLSQRIEKKHLEFGPSYLELLLSELPHIDFYKKIYGSYTYACNELGMEPIFSKGLPKNFWETKIPDFKIFIDTREQKPLSFEDSESMKLDIGDYTASGSHYDYTFVDRKSEPDFKSTLTAGFDRFRRELQRAKESDSYLFVVTERSVEQIEKNNSSYKCPHRVKSMKYVWSNMKKLQQEFAGTVQFVFAGNRKNSEEIIKKILYFGKKLWKTDLQYFIDKNKDF